MSDDLTLFQGRLCTRVRRQAAPSPPANSTAVAVSPAPAATTTAPAANPSPKPPPPAPTNPAAASPADPAKAPEAPKSSTTSFSLKAAISPPPPPMSTPQPETSSATPSSNPPAPAPPAPTETAPVVPPAAGAPPAPTTPTIALPAKTTAPKPAVIPPGAPSSSGTTVVPVPVPVATKPSPGEPARVPPSTPANNPPQNNPPPKNDPNAPAPAANPPAAGAATPPAAANSPPQQSTPPSPAQAASGPQSARPGNQPSPGQGAQASAAQPPLQSAAAGPLAAATAENPGKLGGAAAGTSVYVTTGQDGTPTSLTSTFLLSPTAEPIGKTGNLGSATGAGAGDGHSSAQHARKMAAGKVVGAIAGVVSTLVLACLLFFCMRRVRKRRHRNSGSPLLVRVDRKPPMSEKIGSLFLKRASPQQEHAIPRVPTPLLEGGLARDDSSSRYTSTSRTRASSVPVPAFRERALNILKRTRRSRSPDFVVNRPPRGSATETRPINGPPRGISTPVAHRRSASSVSSIINSWSATSDENNPFRDPDPNSRLHIVNPDLSRSNTAKTILQRLPPILRGKALSPGIKSPASLGSARSPGIVAASAAIPPIIAIPRKPVQRRSQTRNGIENPFADPEPTSAPQLAPLPIQKSLDEQLLIAPLAFRSPTQPSPRPLQHHPSNTSVDSGFVSAKSPDVIHEEQGPGFRGSSDLLKKWHLSSVLNGDGSSRASDSSSASPFRDPRTSKLSLKSGSDRATNSAAGLSRPTTSQYPSYFLEPDSARVSDPFDLDRPELLGLMKSHWTMASRETSLSRTGSNSSRATTTMTGGRSDRKSSGTAHLLD